jgi:hypothetical protein
MLLADVNMVAMQHPNLTFGGGLADNQITPVGLAALILTTVMVLMLPRKSVIVPLLLFLILIPGQQFVIAGFHLFASRIVLILGCMRFLFKSGPIRRTLAAGFTPIDKVFLAWAICRSIAFVLLYRQGSAFANQVGFLWDALCGYFLIRCLVRDVADIRRIAKVFVVIAVIVAACMIYEHFKLTNIFGVFLGGQIAPRIREGKIRCRGPFEQEIIASVFGGTLVPFFLWLWTTPKAKIATVIGLISSVVITLTASSSTGISAAAIGVGTLCLWPLRKHTKKMRWMLVGVIAALALVMKAPVWFILAHVDLVGGSTGWDRANLIDQCIRHFSSWWLVGTADNDTWGFFTFDLCNQFVAEAVQGGLATLILFLVLITRSFRRLGEAGKASTDKSQQWLLWSIGCILCAHIAGFFGISYFDQVKDWWYLTLSMIPAAAMAVRASTEQQAAPESVPDTVPVAYAAQSAVAGAMDGRSVSPSVSGRLFR